MSKRKPANSHARWEAATRTWTADTPGWSSVPSAMGTLPLTPYHVGAVLAQGEQLMAEVPFSDHS
jgi:hypothetical protein